MFSFRNMTMTGAYELIDRLAAGRELVVRDDQNTFEEILDAARAARPHYARFGVLDTGKLSSSELEWLGETGARIFTSDDARPEGLGLAGIAKACARGGGAVALLVNGTLEDRHADLARDGVILHVSNRVRAAGLPALAALAGAAKSGGGFLVYYHHGAPVPELGELAAAGARIHLSDKALEEKDMDLMTTLLEASRAGGAELILYIEKGMPVLFLGTLFAAGAVLFFKTPPSDRRSLMRDLERKAEKRRPAPSSFYMQDAFLP
jgi:hypothetical protein